MHRRFRHTSMIRQYGNFKWNVQSLLNLPSITAGEKYAFLMLNTPIRDPEIALRFWKNATFRMAIDGGGNQIYDLLKKGGLIDKDEFLPNIVSGDFDSIRTEVLAEFQNRKVKIINTPEQDETDFFKGLKVAASSTEMTIIMVLCENEGRFDHIISNLNTLFKAVRHSSLKHLDVFLLNSECLTWLLQPGSHILQIPEHLWTEKSYCALLPIGQPCKHISTTGLKWNLEDGILKFGGMVSSSNTYDISQKNFIVTVKTDNDLIWSMAIN